MIKKKETNGRGEELYGPPYAAIRAKTEHFPGKERVMFPNQSTKVLGRDKLLEELALGSTISQSHFQTPSNTRKLVINHIAYPKDIDRCFLCWKT